MSAEGAVIGEGEQSRRSQGPGDCVPYEVRDDGYVRWRMEANGSRKRVYVHRLLAVAEYGFDAVCGKDVHHENGIKYDNRPENIELKGHVEHAREHGEERAEGDGAWRDGDTLRRLYVERGLTQAEVAAELGCSVATISEWRDRFGIETRERQ